MALLLRAWTAYFLIGWDCIKAANRKPEAPLFEARVAFIHFVSADFLIVFGNMPPGNKKFTSQNT